MGVTDPLAPKGMEPQEPTKKVGPLGGLLGQLLSQKTVFKNLEPEPSPSPP